MAAGGGEDGVLWIAAGVMLVAGALAALFGVRGRRVNDHPVCRRCGFDLIGLYPGAELCPECGGSLAVGRAVRIGARRRRRGLIGVGVVLCVLGVVVASVGVWGTTTGFDWNTIKPVWMLAREGSGMDDAKAALALQEVLRREDAGTLRDSQRASLAERALAYQADASRPWRVEWGDLIERLKLAGALAPGQWDGYARHSVVLRLEARARVRRGSELPARLIVESRAGSMSALEATVECHGLRAGGQGFRRVVEQVSRGLGGSWGGGTSEEFGICPLPNGSEMFWMMLDEEVVVEFVEAAPGVVALESRWEVTVAESDGSGGSGSRWSGSGIEPWDEDDGWTSKPPTGRREFGREDRGPTVAAWREEVSATIEIVPSEVQTVELIADPSVGEELRAAMEVSRLAFQDTGERHVVQGSFDVSAPLPLVVAGEAYCRIDGGEYPLGQVVVGSDDDMGLWMGDTFSGRAPLPRGNTVDVIIRSDPAAAERTVGVTRIWSGELVFEGVRVEKPGERRGMGSVIGALGRRVLGSGGGAGVEQIAELVFADGEEFLDDHVFRAAAVGLPYFYMTDREGRLYIFGMPDGPHDTRVTARATVEKFGDGNDLAMYEGLLLATDWGRLAVYSLDDPVAPALVGRFGGGEDRGSSDLVVLDDIAYVIGWRGIACVDLSDPRAPTERGYIESDRYGWTGCAEGDRLFVGTFGMEPDEQAGVMVYDISDRFSPRPLGFAPMDVPYHLFALGEGRLVAALESGGNGRAVILDVSDPLRPREAGWATCDTARSAALARWGGEEYLFCGGEVFRVEGDELARVTGSPGRGSTLDGQPYRGAGAGGYILVPTDSAVSLLRLPGEEE